MLDFLGFSVFTGCRSARFALEKAGICGVAK
jgi:hypothetical protein